MRTFSRNGSYVTHLPGGITAFVADDVFWSPWYRAGCTNGGAPDGTFDDLARAFPPDGGGRRWVIAHIPPGIDAFSSVWVAHRLATVPFLRAPAQATLLGMLSDPRRGIALLLDAHTHKFAYRIAGASGPHPVPVLLVPSISPYFGNAPSFLTVGVGADGTIRDARVHAYDGHGWRELGGLDSLGLHAFTATELSALQARLHDDPALRAVFANLYGGGVQPPEIDERDWRAYWCAATALQPSEYRRCAGSGGVGLLDAARPVRHRRRPGRLRWRSSSRRCCCSPARRREPREMSVQRVAIVEHQLLFGKALGAIFASDPELDIVGEFRTPSTAELTACAPDIVVLDIDGQGPDVARTIATCIEIGSHPQVCVLSGQASPETMQRCLGAGAAAYVVKDVAPADVINALKIVARGHSYVDARLAGTLLRGRSRGNEKRPPSELSLARDRDPQTDRRGLREQADQLAARSLREDREEPHQPDLLEVEDHGAHASGGSRDPRGDRVGRSREKRAGSGRAC